jgi:rSAM/selenodomain-associated transferase 2
MLPPVRLAIVMPTLNEERVLDVSLPAALALADEVVVSDGGSSDRSVAIARRHGARVVTGPAGRGGQLNRGAAAADADVLLFLHADTRLPAGADRTVREAIAAGAEFGAFSLRFDDRRPLLRFAERLINVRSRLTRLPLGDQAHFMTRAAFERLGGYRDWPILEDLDLARRARRAARSVLVEEAVITAARRYTERGVLRNAATNWLIWLLFACGVSPHHLARMYRHIR